MFAAITLHYLQHGYETRPKKTFITHGEPIAPDALRIRIEEQLGWNCIVSEYRDRFQVK